VLPPGTPVQTSGLVRGGWWEVQAPAAIGWVDSRYLAP
jgi:hypothetical protein